MRQLRRKLLVSTVATLVLLSGWASHVQADSVVASEGFEGAGLPIGWTLTDTGGVSTAITGLAPTEGNQFAWIDTGAFPSPLALLPSILESPSFNIISGETISADVNFMSTDSPNFVDNSEVLLVSGNSVVSTLFAAQAGCGNGTPLPDLVTPSPSVTLSPSTADFQGDVVGPLDGFTYGPIRVAGNCGIISPTLSFPLQGGSMGWVTTSYNPPPGTYQLVFEVQNALDNIDPSALAIDNVRVTTPEPETLALLLIGLVGMLALGALPGLRSRRGRSREYGKSSPRCRARSFRYPHPRAATNS